MYWVVIPSLFNACLSVTLNICLSQPIPSPFKFFLKRMNYPANVSQIITERGRPRGCPEPALGPLWSPCPQLCGPISDRGPVPPGRGRLWTPLLWMLPDDSQVPSGKPPAASRR